MDLLKQLQLDLAARLQSCPDFDHVDVVVQDGTGEKTIGVMRDRLEKIMSGARKTKGKSGLGVLVLMPVVAVKTASRDLPGPQMEIQCPIQVMENHTYNRGEKGTGISAESLAFTILSLGHHFQSRPGTLFFASETAIEPAETDAEMQADIAYQVNLGSPLGVQPFAKCATPRIVLHEGMATLLAATGTSIYYIIGNEGFPWAGDKCAVAYTVPFAVTAGQVIRTAAYADDAVGSDVTELTA